MGLKGFAILSILGFLLFNPNLSKTLAIEPCRTQIAELKPDELIALLNEKTKVFAEIFQDPKFGAEDLRFAAKDIPALSMNHPEGLKNLQISFMELHKLIRDLGKVSISSAKSAQQIFALVLSRVILSRSFLFSAFVAIETANRGLIAAELKDSKDLFDAENFDIAISVLLQNLAETEFVTGKNDNETLVTAAELFVEKFNTDLLHPDHLQSSHRMLLDFYAKRNAAIVRTWNESRVNRSQKLRAAFTPWLPEIAITKVEISAKPVETAPLISISPEISASNTLHPTPAPKSNGQAPKPTDSLKPGTGGAYDLAPPQ